MRTKKQWEERYHPKILRTFSKRLRNDLIDIPYLLTEIPEFGSWYIYGPTGSGKTLKAAHMFIQARKTQYMEKLPGVYLFVSVYDLLEELKSSFNNPEVDEMAVTAKYSTAAFLVLDDLGATRFTEWSMSALQIIINNRYEEMLPTVITSNFSLIDLVEALGDDRIPSRIARMGRVLKLKR